MYLSINYSGPRVLRISYFDQKGVQISRNDHSPHKIPRNTNKKEINSGYKNKKDKQRVLQLPNPKFTTPRWRAAYYIFLSTSSTYSIYSRFNSTSPSQFHIKHEGFFHCNHLHLFKSKTKKQMKRRNLKRNSALETRNPPSFHRIKRLKPEIQLYRCTSRFVSIGKERKFF